MDAAFLSLVSPIYNVGLLEIVFVQQHWYYMFSCNWGTKAIPSPLLVQHRTKEKQGPDSSPDYSKRSVFYQAFRRTRVNLNPSWPCGSLSSFLSNYFTHNHFFLWSHRTLKPSCCLFVCGWSLHSLRASHHQIRVLSCGTLHRALPGRDSWSPWTINKDSREINIIKACALPHHPSLLRPPKSLYTALLHWSSLVALSFLLQVVWPMKPIPGQNVNSRTESAACWDSQFSNQLLFV